MAISVYPEIANFKYEALKEHYYFNETSQNTCPQALYCFLISNNFEDCLRTSVSIGGDTDTLCAMSYAIAEAFYKDIPQQLIANVWSKLDGDIKDVIKRFDRYLGRMNDDRYLAFAIENTIH